jgi:endonuclease/exonuclease/phosphatase family metal-dependent hydrolase
VIYSRSWDGRFPAFCSWVLFRERAGDRLFYVYNVHFDAGSAGNRRRSADLVLSRVSERDRPDAEVVITGDFNAPTFFPTMRKFERAGYTIAETAGSTYHFNIGLHLIPAIDHVVFSDGLRHRDTRLYRRRYAGSRPSDHYPVKVELAWSRGQE